MDSSGPDKDEWPSPVYKVKNLMVLQKCLDFFGQLCKYYLLEEDTAPYNY